MYSWKGFDIKGFEHKIWILGVGSSLTFFGLIFLFLIWPAVYKPMHRQELQIKPGSILYKNWIESNSGVFLEEVYLFNWTNSNEIGQKNFKPKFKEHGPYVFAAKRLRKNLKWNSNDTILYHQMREWHFQSKLSNGSLNESIIHANVITATIVDLIRNQNETIKNEINSILNNQNGSVITKKTVGEWLIDGFKDPVLTYIKKNKTIIPDFKYPFNKFGWFVGKNISDEYDGYFEMNTGAADIKKLGEITQWNYSKRTKYYPGYCGLINGTTGEIWPGYNNNRKYLSVFVRDFCRSINIYPSRDFSFQNIDGYIWTGTNETFDNGQISKDNLCFCPNADPNKCYKNGVTDVSKCYWNLPISISFPHFYLADSSYIKNIEGMTPSKLKHEFSLGLEPITGITLNVNFTHQFNIKLQPIKEIDIYKNITQEFFLPFIWIKHKREINTIMISKLKVILMKFRSGTLYGYVLIGVGIFIMILSLFVTLCIRESYYDVIKNQ